jgi:plastocyanin
MRLLGSRRFVALIAASLALALGPLSGPASAAVAAAGPGGFAAGYVTRVVVIGEGENISFFNADVAPHDFVADGVFLKKKAAKKARWCSGYDKGKCPLFWSPRIGVGETVEVEGLEMLKAGDQVPFFCTLHPSMKGTLIVR